MFKTSEIFSKYALPGAIHKAPVSKDLVLQHESDEIRLLIVWRVILQTGQSLWRFVMNTVMELISKELTGLSRVIL